MGKLWGKIFPTVSPHGRRSVGERAMPPHLAARKHPEPNPPAAVQHTRRDSGRRAGDETIDLLPNAPSFNGCKDTDDKDPPSRISSSLLVTKSVSFADTKLTGKDDVLQEWNNVNKSNKHVKKLLKVWLLIIVK